jgi:hypothetical protein
MENLRGRVDFLIHMKTYDRQPAELIPMHYRTDRESEPVGRTRQPQPEAVPADEVLFDRRAALGYDPDRTP